MVVFFHLGSFVKKCNFVTVVLYYLFCIRSFYLDRVQFDFIYLYIFIYAGGPAAETSRAGGQGTRNREPGDRVPGGGGNLITGAGFS